MRMVINKGDIKNIVGRWIVQLTNEQENSSLLESKNDEFWLEKRIFFVGSLYGADGIPTLTSFKSGESFVIVNGIYHTKGIYNEDQFVEFFNNYSDGKRFHRLLTTKELDWLNEHLKKRLY